MAKIDVYKEWLKIDVPTRPLNYYQLLKFNKFEDDPKVIRERYRELNAHVRKFATGDYIEESQALLNELAKAMLCLTDAERKADYDRSLGRKYEGKTETDAHGRRTLETILLEDGLCSQEQIKKAKNLAEAIGVELHQALLQQKAVDAEKVTIAYAESVGLPFVNLDDTPVDEYFVPFINPVMARQNSFVPVMADMGKLILASPEPVGLDVEDELRTIFDMPVRCAICTVNQVNYAIAKYYPRDAVQKRYVRPDEEEEAPKKAKKEKPAKAKKSAEPEEPREELSDEAKKNRFKLTLVGFNFGVMIGAFGTYFGMKHASLATIIGAAVVAGALGAAACWFFAPKDE
ncbi:MAG: hypothetical protein IJM30_10350 [Thermoguttaceae bacterium]|nr:hypothetical protein [Thermoguttaceae bacterium]